MSRIKVIPLLLMLCGAASSLTACNDHSATPSHSVTNHAGTAQPESSTPPSPRAFAVNTLSLDDGENELNGCTTELTRVGAPESAGAVFRDSSSDTEGTGFIRIDGTLIRVHLTATKVDESSAEKVLRYTHVFEDASRTTRVVEILKNGATNEQADSTQQTGFLTITHGGATQTLRVEGGTAC
ncbi:hypothetical protein [Burkholderia sp. MSHR3999]|uniref:hypothetical protein n=1 Tax=Burkholderia sp. MSHR3999 TaxID=1542965 RepID=UPI0012E0C3FC|nr:hypothetical protein [Burkholderia sp. MSHR3999]